MDQSDRDLVAILFPGIVKNDEKALQCLGGIRAISQVYSHSTKKRLGLTFQPENPYIKKTFADMMDTAGVVLRVRVKKTRINNEVKREVVSTTVVGRVAKIYKFVSMLDFQYLPVHRETTEGPLNCFVEQIIPSGINSSELKPAPLFIVPANFTRTDKPNNYGYTRKQCLPNADNSDNAEHAVLRSKRSIPLVRHDFNLIDDLPSEPPEYYVKTRNSKLKYDPELIKHNETIIKLFEEKPIWSQNLLRYQTKIRLSQLKVLLPCVAYLFNNGPWKLLWVKYGYDPRTDPKSRMYQCLDFRLRHQAGVHSMVTARGSVMAYKKADRVRRTRRNPEPSTLEEISEGAVLFRPGMVPTQRQIYYQYCDVKLPEVEAILSAEPPPGALCHQKRGWLPPGTDDVCRDHIFRYVKQTLLARQTGGFKLEDGSSDEASNVEGDVGDDSSSSEVEGETTNT